MREAITATLPVEGKENGRNYDDKKECTRFYALVGLHNGAMRKLLDCRCFMSRSGDGASPVYASVWINAKKTNGESLYTSGRGTANGGGYDKASAAIQYALDSAGVSLSEAIDGRGDSAVEEALIAIGVALGYAKESLLIVSHF